MVTIEQERELNSIAENEPTKVKLGNGFVKIGWQKRGTTRKCSNIYLDARKDDKTEDNVNCKVAAAMVLNGFFRIKFLYPILWRWYRYIKDYNDKELISVISEGKKKIPLTESYSITMLVQELRDTRQTMTRDEVSHFHPEQLSELKEQ